MKIPSIVFAASFSLFAAAPLCAQTTPVPSYGLSSVLTKEQAQTQSKAQMIQSQVQSIRLPEQGFDRLSNLITANPYHLSRTEVTDGFGDVFDAQMRQEGTLMLSTIIKANRILGRADKWLAQEWVLAWIAAYRLDPATGEPLPAH